MSLCVHREMLRKERSGFRLRAPASLTPAKRLNLPIPASASTLPVFTTSDETK
jgi:hypothetical protein